jgi:hypothetical protein
MDGSERLNFIAFYELLLAAKGLRDLTLSDLSTL